MEVVTMGFFQALAPLLARGPITISLTKEDDGKVKLIIVQVADEGDVGLGRLKHVDTPEQLDQTLAGEITALAAHRDGPVQSILEQGKASMDEAAAEEKRKADERVASAKSRKTTTAKAAGAKGKDAQKFSLGSGESAPAESGGEGGDDPERVESESQAPDKSSAAGSTSVDLFA
jgi:PRTRC genetic system protein E